MKINFSPIYSEILKKPPEYKIVDYKLSITKQSSDFQNFSVVFDIEPENQIFTYLVKTGLLANLEQELYVVKFWAISSSWDISVWKALRPDRVGSPTKSYTYICK